MELFLIKIALFLLLSPQCNLYDFLKFENPKQNIKSLLTLNKENISQIYEAFPGAGNMLGDLYFYVSKADKIALSRMNLKNFYTEMLPT